MPRNVRTPSRSGPLAVAISLLVVLIAILGFFLGAWLELGWSSSVAYSVSSAVLSIGLISFLYEFRLRQAVEDELLRLVGIQGSLSTNQIVAAGDSGGIDWGSIIDPAAQFHVLLAQPGVWVQSNWSRVVRVGRDRKIAVDLFLPNPDGPCLSALAAYLGLPDQELKLDITRAKSVAEDGWKIAHDNRQLREGSRLKIAFFDNIPAHSVVQADRRCVLFFASATGRQPAETGFSMRFEGPENIYPISWIAEEFGRLEKGPAEYENTVRELK